MQAFSKCPLTPCGKCFLQQQIADIFFAAEHAVDSRGAAPFGFAGYDFDAVFLEISFDFSATITLQIELEDSANDFGSFGTMTKLPLSSLV
jgi:hypothetical protein